MRKLIKIIVFLVILLVVAAMAIPFLVPLDTYKKEIIAQVKSKTGRDLQINGTIKASIFPVLGIELEQASLSNPEGYTSKQMLQVDKLTVQVEALPLLHKQIQVKSFILARPIINLEKNAVGKANWEFGEQAVQNVKPEAATVPAAKNDSSAALLGGLMLGEVKISDGEIYYRDAQAKKTMSLKALNMNASLPGITQPFNADGSAIWNEQKVSINVLLSKPDAFMNGTGSGVKASVQSPAVTFNYEGSATQQTTKGTLALAIGSVPEAAKWAGSPMDWKGKAKLAVNVQGALDCSATACTLANSDISVDDIKAKGNLRALLDSKVPSVEANLAFDRLDINPYLPQQQASNTFSFISPAMAMEWSNDRIDLSGLRALNAKINLTASSILYNKISVGKTIASLVLSNGTLNLNITEAALYSGNAKISTTLDASGPMVNEVTLEHVQAEPFLKDAADYDRLSGALNMTANLKGNFTSQRDFINSLNGNGHIRFTDGSYKGVDIAGMVRNLKTSIKGGENSQQKTDFSELGGSFTIASGIVTNNDLAMKAPLLRLTGQGTINLPLYAINYRLIPEIVGSLQGQGGKDKQGIQIPIMVTGALDHPQFTPDVAGAAQRALENPQAIKDTAKSVKEQIKNSKGGLKELKGMFKGFGKSSAQ